jgi:hypothetical protein
MSKTLTQYDSNTYTADENGHVLIDTFDTTSTQSGAMYVNITGAQASYGLGFVPYDISSGAPVQSALSIDGGYATGLSGAQTVGFDFNTPSTSYLLMLFTTPGDTITCSVTLVLGSPPINDELPSTSLTEAVNPPGSDDPTTILSLATDTEAGAVVVLDAFGYMVSCGVTWEFAGCSAAFGALDSGTFFWQLHGVANSLGSGVWNVSFTLSAATGGDGEATSYVALQTESDVSGALTFVVTPSNANLSIQGAAIMETV